MDARSSGWRTTTPSIRSPMMAGSLSTRATTSKLREANPWLRARARPRLPTPAMTTVQSRSSPSWRSICSTRKATS